MKKDLVSMAYDSICRRIITLEYEPGAQLNELQRLLKQTVQKILYYLKTMRRLIESNPYIKLPYFFILPKRSNLRDRGTKYPTDLRLIFNASYYNT
jgi:hypothetical protein